MCNKNVRTDGAMAKEAWRDIMMSLRVQNTDVPAATYYFNVTHQFQFSNSVIS
ncbi:hypothetical protein [Mucilaginibacter sp. SG564]|uniref:hypothetical protein n=1 Tax=Mucilaginibacter sp. SG564 TaxID=2587022 RepID=UPI001557A5A4|nr:hypothetical protein [Mucilaginibacter sp. SG564]NOW99181.1 hypothetical protein [Mucilaginibacter sp. SG564]